MSQNFRVYLFLTISLLMTATIFPCIKYALSGFSPEGLALFRYFSAAICLIVIGAMNHIRIPSKRDILYFILTGTFVNALFHLLLNNGQETVKSGTVSLLINSYPFLVALMSVFILKEKISKAGWIGIGVCLIGSVLVTVGDGNGFNISNGIFLIIGATFLNALCTIILKYFLYRYTPLEVLTYVFIFTALPLLIFAPKLYQDLRNIEAAPLIAGIYLGVVILVFSALLSTYVLSKLPASKMSTFSFISPLLSVAIAWLWLGEIPTIFTIVGAVIILTGVVLVNKYGKIEERVRQLSE